MKPPVVSRSAVAPHDWRRAAESHEGRLAAITWSGGLVCDRIRALLLIHQIDVICTHVHTNALGSENGGGGRRGRRRRKRKKWEILILKKKNTHKKKRVTPTRVVSTAKRQLTIMQAFP